MKEKYNLVLGLTCLGFFASCGEKKLTVTDLSTDSEPISRVESSTSGISEEEYSKLADSYTDLLEKSKNLVESYGTLKENHDKQTLLLQDQIDTQKKAVCSIIDDNCRIDGLQEDLDAAIKKYNDVLTQFYAEKTELTTLSDSLTNAVEVLHTFEQENLNFLSRLERDSVIFYDKSLASQKQKIITDKTNDIVKKNGRLASLRKLLFSTFTAAALSKKVDIATVRLLLTTVTKDAKKATTAEANPSSFKGLEGKVVIGSATSGKTTIKDRASLKEDYAGMYDNSAYNQLSSLADSTGTFLGFSPKSEMLPSVVNEIFSKLVLSSSNKIDVALVIDTTGSMGDDINAVKVQLNTFLEKLKSHKKNTFRLSVILFKDAKEDYIVKEIMGLTDDLDLVSKKIKAITVNGGGDHPEAMLDALEHARTELNWDANASKNIIVFTDAPGHTRGKGDNEDLTLPSFKSSLKADKKSLFVFPILIGR